VHYCPLTNHFLLLLRRLTLLVLLGGRPSMILWRLLARSPILHAIPISIVRLCRSSSSGLDGLPCSYVRPLRSLFVGCPLRRGRPLRPRGTPPVAGLTGRVRRFDFIVQSRRRHAGFRRGRSRIPLRILHRSLVVRAGHDRGGKVLPYSDVFYAALKMGVVSWVPGLNAPTFELRDATRRDCFPAEARSGTPSFW
jgi:hypothetical protein